MKTHATSDHDRQLSGRVAMTITVACAAAVAVFLVSGALRAIAQIGRVENALAELSHYVADGHAAIRSSFATLAGFDSGSLARFDAGVERRVSGLRTLNVVLEEGISTYWWTEPLRKDVDIPRFEQDRNAYVASAETTAATGGQDSAIGLRLFDLRAQKLLQNIEAMRDSVDTARARALVDVDGLMALSSGIGVLLIAYLIWCLVFGVNGHSAGLRARNLKLETCGWRLRRACEPPDGFRPATVPGNR